MIKFVEDMGGQISPTNQNLLIFDGHGLHVTLDVVHQAKVVYLDLIHCLSIHCTPSNR
jgi:hypothetical protein